MAGEELEIQWGEFEERWSKAVKTHQQIVEFFSVLANREVF